MVTHDPRAAATAERAVFLSDGRVVDEARDPDQDEILERIIGVFAGLLPARSAARKSIVEAVQYE